MPRIRLLVGFAGVLEGHDTPAAGTELDVSRALADALCDGERAELVSERKARRANVEHAVTRPLENRGAGSDSSREP